MLDSLAKEIFTRISEEANRLVRYNNKQTISMETIQAAVKLLLPGEMATHAVAECKKAVSSYK